jgi:hypothetical protein
MANSRQRKKQTARGEEPSAVVKDESAAVPPEVVAAAASHPAAAPTVEPAAVEATPDETPRRRIRLITSPAAATMPQTTMGRAIRPFAKPAQSGTFAPFAVAQARRGH